MPRPKPRFSPSRDFFAAHNGTWVIWDSTMETYVMDERYYERIPVRFFTRADARIGVQIIKEKADAIAAAASR